MPSSVRTAGSDGGCVQRGYFCPAVHETPAVVAQDQGVFLEGKSTVQTKRSPCVGAHWQHSGGFLYQPPRRSAFTPPVQAGAPDPWVVPGQTLLAENSSYSWASEYGRRHPVEAGAEARGMEASPRGGEADLESLARLRWICLRLERHGIVPSGSL